MTPQFYFEWGNEPRGFVSTGAYDENGLYHFTGYLAKEKNKLPFNCPFS